MADSGELGKTIRELKALLAGEPTGKPDPWTTFNADSAPLYGCITGIELPCSSFEIALGIELRQAFVDVFGATMMAFAPPATPRAPHPPPWGAVRGGFNFEARVELAVTEDADLSNLPASSVAWLVTSLVRLQASAPVRLAALSNISFQAMRQDPAIMSATLFEGSASQFGEYKLQYQKPTIEDLTALTDMYSSVIGLYRLGRFRRAFDIYEQAQWGATIEVSKTLLWTSVEILFGLSGEREKTKAICGALSSYLTTTRADRDKMFPIVRELYRMRGSVVHGGGIVSPTDFMASFGLVKAVFRKVLSDRAMPTPSSP